MMTLKDFEKKHKDKSFPSPVLDGNLVERIGHDEVWEVCDNEDDDNTGFLIVSRDNVIVEVKEDFECDISTLLSVMGLI